MRTKFIKLAIMTFIFATTAKLSQAYNLSPISFENFYRIAADGDLQGLKNVQRRGLNINSTNMDGDTAVCVAIKRQDYLAYKTLLRAGAKSNPDCVERMPEYAHKSFLANYNQKYAAPQTPTNWAKSGTAFVVGGGIAAGIVALASSGGGGGGSSKGSSNADDASNSTKCELNPCAEGCYENVTCQTGYQCTQYESKCNLGCIKCEKKPECTNVPECTGGCYTNLTCQSGYECTKYNKCNGCEKCEKVIKPDTSDTSNRRNCQDYDSAKNYCNTCNNGYTAINGACKLNAPEHCMDYSYSDEKCAACESGYRLQQDKRTCLKDSGTGGDTSTCTAAEYPLTAQPANAAYASCVNGSTTRYKITSCNIGYTLSADRKSCTSTPTESCTAAEYPLTAQPANAAYASCVNGSTTRYKITSCNTGYTLSTNGLTCTKNSSGGQDACDVQQYPLTSKPENAYTNECKDESGVHYKISSCTNGTTLSTDKLSCVTTCDKSVYNLTECNNGSVCTSCTDTTGTYYKFSKCAAGFEQDGLSESCVQKEILTSDKDVVNNDNITVDNNNGLIVKSTRKNWLLGFTNYTSTGETVSSNLYNARDKEASITINDADEFNPYPAIMGLGSIYSKTPVVINSYNNHTGKITITSVNQNAIYGIMTTGGAYNSYNGNGIIKLTRNTSSPNEAQGFLYGMGAWTEGVDSISGISKRQIADDTSFLYNAFGGSGLIHLESNKDNVYGMKGYNVINATNGGNGTIEIVAQDGDAYGLIGMYDFTPSLTANAYSLDGLNTVGNITITANNGHAYISGIESVMDGLAYNAYGKNATGNITINGAGKGRIIGIMNGTNAANSGQGYITINVNDAANSIIGIENNSSRTLNYNAQGAGSVGSIKISVSSKVTETIYGMKGLVDNGSIDGGIGKIEIIDTGNNGIVGMNLGNNHKDSYIKITSNADSEDDKNIMGLTNVDFSSKNYGSIEVNSKGSADAYGIYIKDAKIENTGTVTLNRYNDGTSYGIYRDEYKEDFNNGTVKMKNTASKGVMNGLLNINNSIGGKIYITSTTESNLYGIRHTGKSTAINGASGSIATSENDTEHGYINITSTTNARGIDSIEGGALNYGVIQMSSGTGIKAKMDVLNYGVIQMSSGTGINAEGNITNNGHIIADDNKSFTGIYHSDTSHPHNWENTYVDFVFDTNKIINNGTIYAKNSTSAIGIVGPNAENNGTIIINSTSESITGMRGAFSVNNGIIQINSKVLSSNTKNQIIGLGNDDYVTYSQGLLTNNATLTIDGNDFARATGMSGLNNLLSNMYKAYKSLAYNSGTGKIDILNTSTTNGMNAINRYTAQNDGIINIQNVNDAEYTRGIWAYRESQAINNGSIILDNISVSTDNTTSRDYLGDISGMYANLNSSVVNTGKITINNADANSIYGIYHVQKRKTETESDDGAVSCGDECLKNPNTLFNSGNINITGNNNAVYGIYGSNIKIKNTGNITLTNVDKNNSYGIYAVNGSKVFNSGTISINGETYDKNEADGKFIYIDSSSAMVNENEISVNTAFDVSALGGGKFVLAKGGKITAPEVKGNITADANITAGGFDKTYSNKDAFSGKTDEVKLNSGSALFDATLKNNDIVMTMKDFDKVVDNKSLAAYLQRNYDAKRNEQLFDSLKLSPTAQHLNNLLNKNLGFSLLPNFAQENLNVFRSLSNLVTDTMFSQDLTNERMMVGYDYLGQDRSSKGGVTGYENTANSSYFLADTKLNNRQRFGLGVALTRFNSDYDDDSSRKATFAQVMGSFMNDFGNSWKYAGLLRAGYADGEYKRQADGSRIKGNTGDVLYGFNNELRYIYDLGFVSIEPQLELNAYGYYQRKINEDDSKTNALQIKGTNNLSVETGAGLYASKDAVYGENGKIKGRLGGSYYRELSQPYHSMQARVKDTDGYYLIESTDIFDRNRVIVRADVTFSWKALDFYLRGSQFMEDKHTTVINAGVKYNF